MTRAAIKHGEEQLRQAMLAGDVDALDRLIHDELLFLAPSGALAGKSDNLESYREGRQRITRLEPRDLSVALFGEDIGVATVLTELEGVLDDVPFSGTYRYIRTWRREAGRWQVIAGALMTAT